MLTLNQSYATLSALEDAMTKPIQIRLQDETGKIVRWSIRHDSRPVATWDYTDHQGYTRSVEGNWRDLVFRVKLTAENYNLQLMSELS